MVWHAYPHNPQPKPNSSPVQGGLIRVGPNQLVTSDIDAILRIISPLSRYSGVPESPCPNRSHSSLSCPEGKKCPRQAAPRGSKGGSQLEAIADRRCGCLIRLIEEEFISTEVAFRPLEMASASRWFVSNFLRDLVSCESPASLEEVQHWCNMPDAKRPCMSRLVAALLPVRMMRACRRHIDSNEDPGFKDEHDLKYNHRKTNLCDVDEEETKGVPDKLRDWAHLTAAALATTILHLLKSPTAYHKLKSEIIGCGVSPGSRLPAPPVPRSLSLPSTLPYLRAVVKEGCRMSDAVTAVPPVFRKSPKTVDTILGFEIPGGTEVGADSFGIMQAKKHWGTTLKSFGLS
ncbi:hypothetical protein PG997_007387, partial [Apiospora hydei]